MIVGLLVGAVCAYAVGLKFRLGFDDSLDVVGVHLVGGLLGTVLIGLFAVDGGLFHGGGIRLLLIQTLVALFACLYSGVVTLVIGLGLKKTMGWRISPEDEVRGIDLAEHSESAYESMSAAARLA